ncbi:hypothetical protein AKJ41_03490 [candidate division MSBL1 archaeon SCGC-AAA259O05]|uniref:Uncharacterized protein n=1 Tax=candidate division MSBL1 archaeon SCGC-AAA259O05 TaxID=1698271 RepID=A0A133V395_9EURY|nr:hypothetical protein AKJ41_03490 [candidate division MSBL1 archaeon SCGC-AAA259O05]
MSEDIAECEFCKQCFPVECELKGEREYMVRSFRESQKRGSGAHIVFGFNEEGEPKYYFGVMGVANFSMSEKQTRMTNNFLVACSGR